MHKKFSILNFRAGVQRTLRGIWPALTAVLMLATCGALRAAGTGVVDRVSGWYPAGTNLTVTATPAVYSQFDYWSGDTNAATITGDQMSFNVTGPRSITAVFKDGMTTVGSVPFAWLGAVNPSWTNDFDAAVTNDADADGFLTYQEYWSGTDPIDNGSFLRIDSLSLSGGNVLLEWRHSKVDAGLPAIQVQRRTDLVSGVWTNIGTNAPSNGTNTWMTPLSSDAVFRLIAPVP